MSADKDMFVKMISYSFNDWLDDNTKRVSLFNLEYNGKFYKGYDSLRRIYLVELRHNPIKVKKFKEKTICLSIEQYNQFSSFLKKANH